MELHNEWVNMKCDEEVNKLCEKAEHEKKKLFVIDFLLQSVRESVEKLNKQDLELVKAMKALDDDRYIDKVHEIEGRYTDVTRQDVKTTIIKIRKMLLEIGKIV